MRTTLPNQAPASLPPSPHSTAGPACPSLYLDPAVVAAARVHARAIAGQVLEFAEGHSTVAIERTLLRLFGLDGETTLGVPLVNACVERLARLGLLGSGASLPFCAVLEAQAADPALATDSGDKGGTVADVDLSASAIEAAARQVVRRQVDVVALVTAARAEPRRLARVYAIGAFLARRGIDRLLASRAERDRLLALHGSGAEPLLYVIVATGNIHEDIVQARVAVRQGADVIAVIRSTGQSLLDYVPQGATTVGYGGTFATQENFRLMRQALDEVGADQGRYIRLCNYASGLCMPEISLMGGFERLDLMLNDALYGILFRDINMQRTLCDQRLSRRLSALAGIIINTGEDNYLTTAEAVEAAHTVVASTLINEAIARGSGLQTGMLGLGHAMEIDPDREDALVLEIAQAALIRTLFPGCPIKYMPPTRHMTGNIMRGHVQDALFDLVGVLTAQGIQLLGMLTEAMHTPHIHDRYLALETAKMIFKSARSLGSELVFRSDGRIAAHAETTLAKAEALLAKIAEIGLMPTLAAGHFADIARSIDGGRGLDGVFARSADYWDPSEVPISAELVAHNGFDPAQRWTP